jgi:hypothetical protein
MDDRRVFARINTQIPIRFLDDEENKVGNGQTLNISANGVGFITKEKLPVNAPLEIWLDIPDHHEPLYIQGEIVWSRPLDSDNLQRIGVCLKREDLIGLARALWNKASA